jgi:hypothetical protein
MKKDIKESANIKPGSSKEIFLHYIFSGVPV